MNQLIEENTNFNTFKNIDISISCQNGLFSALLSFDGKPAVQDIIYLNFHALSKKKKKKKKKKIANELYFHLFIAYKDEM